MPGAYRYRPTLGLGGAWATLPLACAGAGRCPDPGNSAWLEERGTGERPGSGGDGARLPHQFPRGLSPRGGKGRRLTGFESLLHARYLATLLTATSGMCMLLAPPPFS